MILILLLYNTKSVVEVYSSSLLQVLTYRGFVSGDCGVALAAVL